VREALRDLEQVGCVVHEPYRGCSVRAVSPQELLEAFPVRQALEALAARACAERRDDALLDELEQAIRDMRAAAEAGDALAEARADAGFHGAIVRGAGNATLGRQWVLLEPTLRTYITVSQPGTDLSVLAERHVPILEAIRRGDGDAAAQAMVDHLAEAASGLRRALEGSHRR
jgi:DNA-binding GntR family transcriptional regulator